MTRSHVKVVTDDIEAQVSGVIKDGEVLDMEVDWVEVMGHRLDEVPAGLLHELVSMSEPLWQ